MKLFVTACCLLIVLPCSAADDKAKGSGKKDETIVKTTKVVIKDLELMVPNTWEKAENTNSMRLATYKTPAAKGSDSKGELTIFSFPGGGGGVAQNLERWVGQFSAEGRKSKITQGKAGDNTYYFADVTGTFNKSIGGPFSGRKEAVPGSRMLAAIVVLEGKGVYFLKLVGPEAAITAEAKRFRKSFGGDPKTEESFGQ